MSFVPTPFTPWRVIWVVLIINITGSVFGLPGVLHLDRRILRWWKDELVVLLGNQGPCLSTCVVGRILRDGNERGVLAPQRLALSWFIFSPACNGRSSKGQRCPI
jgi:hypothetical protein